jgi:hypothetical protein
MTNSRTKTRAMIPNPFTQRGVPLVDPGSGFTRVSSPVALLEPCPWLEPKPGRQMTCQNQVRWARNVASYPVLTKGAARATRLRPGLLHDQQ